MKPVIQQDRTGCAIASAAALAGTSYEAIKQLTNAVGIDVWDPALWSDTRPMVELLKAVGITIPEQVTGFESWETLPDCALLAVKWREEQGRASWHWVVFVNDGNDRYVLDPKKGLKSNVRRDFGRIKPKWYIPVDNPPGMRFELPPEYRLSADKKVKRVSRLISL
jgi:hypothetical protein